MIEYIVIGALAVLSGATEQPAPQSGYDETCTSVTFRETPFADIRCGRRIQPDTVAERKHFRIRYDTQGRVTEVTYQQNGHLRPYADRFVRAPRTVIRYTEDQEIRTYYNEWGHRTLVSGDVYESQFQLDEDGNRTSLIFLGLDKKPVANDFGIARYDWQLLDDGSVLEKRYDLTGNLVRNRPGFGYMITRFSYDVKGLLARMYNLGTDGKQITEDTAGIAITHIDYDQHGQFTRWLNLTAGGAPKRGMSNIAEIRYVPSDFCTRADSNLH